MGDHTLAPLRHEAADPRKGKQVDKPGVHPTQALPYCPPRLSAQGIMHPEDAALAMEAGVDGIIVSNHGGRQLDTAPSAVDALPAVRRVIRGRVPLLVDGGIRRGTDIVKCLALGASAVLVGRPVLWGLAAGGRAGVERVLDILIDELRLTMQLCGATSLERIDESVLMPGTAPRGDLWRPKL